MLMLEMIWLRFKGKFASIWWDMKENNWCDVIGHIIVPCFYISGITLTTLAAIHFNDTWWSLIPIFGLGGFFGGVAMIGMFLAVTYPIVFVHNVIAQAHKDACNVREREEQHRQYKERMGLDK